MLVAAAGGGAAPPGAGAAAVVSSLPPQPAKATVSKPAAIKPVQRYQVRCLPDWLSIFTVFPFLRVDIEYTDTIFPVAIFREFTGIVLT
jgi:hypothetical protein